MDPRVEKLADVLVNYCVAVQPGNWVIIQSGFPGEPLVDACVAKVLKAGGHPSPQFASQMVGETFMREAGEEQLTFISPMTRASNEQADVSITIMAPRNTRAMSGIDPAKMAAQSRAIEPLMATMMQREAEGKFRWTGTAYPTEAGAQDAGMSLRAYEDFVYGAGLLDEDDPVAAWKAVGERQQRVADWLSDKKTIHITGPGTDLTVGVAGRTWVNDDGHANFPGGEVFTGPLEDATEGVIEFNYPGFYRGREVTGIRLVFEKGKVTDARAATDEAFLMEMLNLDEGARRLGEFAFGLNPGVQRFTKNTLFDEKIGGTLHMALGRSIPETEGQNVSALHWDIVYDLRSNGAVVTVDGQVFIKDGRLQV
ncbi:MAG TPA: aminopeptidase [Chloroflexota bacterium]|nr:aminopeptidase [Chloroflexota bacterium]